MEPEPTKKAASQPTTQQGSVRQSCFKGKAGGRVGGRDRLPKSGYSVFLFGAVPPPINFPQVQVCALCVCVCVCLCRFPFGGYFSEKAPQKITNSQHVDKLQWLTRNGRETHIIQQYLMETDPWYQNQVYNLGRRTGCITIALFHEFSYDECMSFSNFLLRQLLCTYQTIGKASTYLSILMFLFGSGAALAFRASRALCCYARIRIKTRTKHS